MFTRKNKPYFSKLVITLFSTLILFFAGSFSDSLLNKSVVEQVRCLFLDSYHTINDVLERPVIVTSKISSSSCSFSLSTYNYFQLNTFIIYCTI